MKGFTLIEILLVIGILGILISFVIPVSLNFYKNQQLETQTQSIIQTLRKAQLKASSVDLDSSFGVYLTDSNYTLFKGDFFATRDSQYDEIFDFPEIINISGLSEIVFLKSEGIPKETPTYCGGICTSCNGLNRNQCRQQQGCRWRWWQCIDNPGCTPCHTLDQDSCGSSIEEPQYGCTWYPGIRGGNIILSSDGESRTININEMGRINLE